MRTPVQTALAICLLFCAIAFAGPKRDITLDDYFTQAYIASSAISPDGKWVAYTEMRWEKPREERNHDLWVGGSQHG
ncbi:MAG: hypothetical protein IPP40_15270 [bacterium]|nr:hypothetical protein [bacterium]